MTAGPIPGKREDSWQACRRLGKIYPSNTTTLESELRRPLMGVTTKYTLNGDKVTLEDNGTDKIYYSYDAAGNLVSMNLNGTEYYYIRNVQGDITGLFNNAGTQVVNYTYDSWGKLISATGTLASTVGAKNPYLYRGYRADTETGLYYLQSRYYSPDWGRFINADDIVGKVGQLLTHNMFAYCGNNPVNNEDPSGRFFIPILFIPMIASAIASVVAYTATWALGYHDFSWTEMATEAVKDATFGMIGGAVANKIASVVVSKTAPKAIEKGIVYLRTDLMTGNQYVGQAKSEARFVARQAEHARANKDAMYTFGELGRATPGRELNILEQKMSTYSVNHSKALHIS